MKLLCINDKKIRIETDTHIFEASGECLKEGNEYDTRGKTFKDEDGLDCYYIEGVGAKLACRFTELLEEQEIVATKAINKLKEEV